MLTKLTHPTPDHELWVDLSDVVSIERKNEPPKSSIIRVDESPAGTRLTLTSGKQIICMDTPEVILSSIT